MPHPFEKSRLLHKGLYQISLIHEVCQIWCFGKNSPITFNNFQSTSENNIIEINTKVDINQYFILLLSLLSGPIWEIEVVCKLVNYREWHPTTETSDLMLKAFQVSSVSMKHLNSPVPSWIIRKKFYFQVALARASFLRLVFIVVIVIRT